MESRQQRATTALLAILTLLMLGLMARPAHAQTGPYSAEIQRALRGARAGSTMLTTSTATACTIADTNETTLWSFQLPANTLNEDGKTVRITATMLYGATANSKTVKVKLGATAAYTYATASNAIPGSVTVTITRTGATAELATGNDLRGNAGFNVGSQVSMAEDLSTALTVSLTGQNAVAAASDVCVKSATLELLQTNTSNIVTATGGPIANPLLLPNGAITAPALAFASETNTGLWKAGAGDLRFNVAGTDRLRLSGTTVTIPDVGSLAWGSSGISTPDTVLARDTANTIGQRNATNGQTFRIYNTYTDGSNNERLTLNAPTGNTAQILTEAAGTGAARALRLGTSGNASLIFRTNGTDIWSINGSGTLLAATDNTYDIGAAGANRPQNLFVANVFQVGNGARMAAPTGDGTLRLSNAAATDFSLLQFGGTGVGFPAIKRASAGLEARLADDSAATTFRATDFKFTNAIRNDIGGTNVVLIAGAAPTISSGFGTTPSVTTNNGTAAFLLNVGTGGTASSGVIGLPTATNSWNCFVTDTTAAANHTGLQTLQTGSTTTTVTVESQNSAGAATAWAASTGLRVSCFAQ